MDEDVRKRTIKQTLGSYANRDLAQRRSWYSPAAEAYNQARPHYPYGIIRQVIESTQLSGDSRILEVGCGPGTATVAFAALGCSILGLEPNPDFYKLAQQNCAQYPNVTLQNMAFEDWSLEADSFDAVLAATSFHWIPTAVGYPKAAKALKPKGRLILLWNKELQPPFEIHQQLAKIYQAYAPHLDRYEDPTTQAKILRDLGQIALESEHFKDLVTGQIKTDVTYSTDQYLTLLNTYSPYLELDSQVRAKLFVELNHEIETNWGGRLSLSYVSAFHIVQKC